MGFAVAYQTTEQISPALQREMIHAAKDLSSGRTWLSCEPPYLMNENGTLVGASKPNFSPHPDDVASAKSEGLPDGTLSDTLEILCELSRRFDVDWEISHDHSAGPLGYIRNGVCDDDVTTQCDALTDLADELGAEGFDLDDL
ncbi:hypothetical protein [Novipirellula rosea]|uniref:Uncharacterized protein n=1 Tax=Novipirellula rosea TaxID=1031540 RepID=A0ABP8M593_9BACT